MHIFNTSVTYVQSTNKYTLTALGGVDFTSITITIHILQPLSYQTCNVLWLRCVANLIQIGQKLHLLFIQQNFKMLTEGQTG